MKTKKNMEKMKIVSASFVLLTSAINPSPVGAQNLSSLSMADTIIKILTTKEYKVDEDTYSANIKVPKIQGLTNKELQNSLNDKYLDESKKLYNKFVEDMEQLEKAGGGHLALDQGYMVKTDTDKILSIGRFVVNIMGSSSTTSRYDNIDKEKQILISLSDLFKDDSYIEIISNNIKAQMKEQMKSDESKSYQPESEDDSIGPIEKNLKEEKFYINNKGKLVIPFDKYEVAPGYMGTPEFIIPTEILSEILVSSEYIR